jgi:hypothetical protein
LTVLRDSAFFPYVWQKLFENFTSGGEHITTEDSIPADAILSFWMEWRFVV